jgi:hypothetical protein
MDPVSFLLGALTMLVIMVVLAGWAVINEPRKDPHGNDPTAAIRKSP